MISKKLIIWFFGILGKREEPFKKPNEWIVICRKLLVCTYHACENCIGVFTNSNLVAAFGMARFSPLSLVTDNSTASLKTLFSAR